MKIESGASAEEKKLWKVVRVDSYTDVPGDIVSADEQSGNCTMMIAGESKNFSFGEHGIRIVRRAR
jgi:hypothetical protein